MHTSDMNNTVAAIELHGAVKRYGTFEAVKGVSFNVPQGETFGLLGPNGAGKTSLIECIEGLRQADGGEIRILGAPVRSSDRAAKAKIGIQLQSTSYYEELTVRELLNLFASFYPAHLPIDAVLDWLNLQEKQHTRAGALSGGQFQRVSLALAMVNDPEILFLDEPTTGLDPHARRSLWQVIQHLQTQGKTIFLTTHYMEEAEYLCDRVAIMNAGMVIALDSPEALIKEHIGEKTIEVSYQGQLPTDEIESLPALVRVWVRPAKLILVSSDEKQTLAALLDLHLPEARMDDIVIRRGNLEDVFLQLTNRGLEE